MELSPRLRAVAGMVPQGANLADIGTDHGLLPVWLLQRGVIERAIAADLRPGPLDAARRTAARFGVSEAVSFRLCNGLTGILPNEADTIVIAGLGGETIANILAAAPWTFKEGPLLLLQPQSAFYELRSFLCGHGYRILEEKIVREANRLYIAMKVRAGAVEEMSAGELWAGKNSSDPLRGDYLDWMVGVLGRAAGGKRRSSGRDDRELAGLQCALEDMRQMKEEWEAWQLP